MLVDVGRIDTVVVVFVAQIIIGRVKTEVGLPVGARRLILPGIELGAYTKSADGEIMGTKLLLCNNPPTSV